MTPAAIFNNVNSHAVNFLKSIDVFSGMKKMGIHKFIQTNTLNYYVCRSIPFLCQLTLGVSLDSFDSPINHDLFY